MISRVAKDILPVGEGRSNCGEIRPGLPTEVCERLAGMNRLFEIPSDNNQVDAGVPCLADYIGEVGCISCKSNIYEHLKLQIGRPLSCTARYFLGEGIVAVQNGNCCKPGIVSQSQHTLRVAAGRCQNTEYIAITPTPYIVSCRTSSQHGKVGGIRDGCNGSRELAGIGCKYVVHRPCRYEFPINLFCHFGIAVVVKDHKFYGPSQDAAAPIHLISPKFIGTLMHSRWLLKLAGESQGNSNADRF